MKVRNKKLVYTIIGIVAVLLVTIGITYAYWLITKNQTGENVISSACLDISLTNEENDITLTNQFPLSDEDGAKLTPYTFTVTNNCNTSVDYHINLESIGTESEAVIPSAIKAMLDENTPQVLSDYNEKDITVEGAYEAHLLGSGTLSSKDTEGSSVTHGLRLWIDEDAPISEMNKTFGSKISVTIGQGIVNSHIKTGTLAYDILSNYGGASSITKIDATTKNHVIYESGNIFIGASSEYNYYYATSYTYDEATGKYTLSGTLTLANLGECRAGTKSCGKYTLRNTSSTGTNSILYEITDYSSTVNNSHYATGNKIKYTSEFGRATTASDAGLYTAQDDYGFSYYFRGAPENNYVQFGKWAENGYNSYWANGPAGEYYDSLEACEAGFNHTTYNEECIKVGASEGDPMYWRIVRINGDGTIRLIYAGAELVANGTAHNAIVAEASTLLTGDAKYVGYTYDDGTGVQTDSAIKGVLDNWYVNNLALSYSQYIADSIFCNDREISYYRYYDADLKLTTLDQAIYITTYFAPYKRLVDNINPQLTCTNQSDRYTVDDTTKGNGLLTKPIGLITADEIFLAGLGANSYMYSGEPYLTITPYSFDSFDGSVAMGVGGENGYYSSNIRPVINLKADVSFTGSGTIDDPYVIGE